MLCRLCRLNDAIANSHIVPKFVGKWLKETSPLGGLRNVDEPNLRKQDTTKIPLLCDDCEKRFSQRGEDLFAKEIFSPFNDDGQHEFDYSGWLLYFAISLCWRVGVSLLDDVRSRNPSVASHLEKALSVWRNFLLGNSSDSGEYAHHLFFDCMYSCEEYVGSCYDRRYALRTIGYAVPFGDESVAVYVKLPGMVFFSAVHPVGPAGWKNTQILKSGTMTTAGQEVSDSSFWAYMRDDALNVAQSMNAMSDKQRKTLEERMETAQPVSKIRQARAKKRGTSFK